MRVKFLAVGGFAIGLVSARAAEDRNITSVPPTLTTSVCNGTSFASAYSALSTVVQAGEVTPTMHHHGSIGTIVKETGLPTPVAPIVEAKTPDTEDSYDFNLVLGSLKHDPDGIFHTGDDGIVRSYTPNGTVIDHAPLSNRQIMDAIDSRFISHHGDREYLRALFANVSGHDVTNIEQRTNPPTWLKPRAFQSEKATMEFQAEAKSENEAIAVKKRLTRRSWGLDPDMPYCYGKDCKNHGGCQFMGCLYCNTIDNMRAKVCLGIQPSPPPPLIGCNWYPYC